MGRIAHVTDRSQGKAGLMEQEMILQRNSRVIQESNKQRSLTVESLEPYHTE